MEAEKTIQFFEELMNLMAGWDSELKNRKVTLEYMETSLKELRELERLSKIGQATEKAFKDGYIFCFKRPDGTILECMKNEQELLKED